MNTSWLSYHTVRDTDRVEGTCPSIWFLHDVKNGTTRNPAPIRYLTSGLICVCQNIRHFTRSGPL